MAGQRVNADIINRTIGGALLSAAYGGGALTRADGSFEIQNLPPGEYNVYSGDVNNTVNLPLIVGGGDVDGLTLTPLRASVVSGSITTDEGAPPPFPPGRMQVVPISADTDGVFPTPSSPNHKLSDLIGHFVFRISTADFCFEPRAFPMNGCSKRCRLAVAT